jgi:hypothetical protein
MYVQVGHPATLTPDRREQVTLRTAMAAAFAMRTESLLVVWNGVAVPIRFHDQLYFVLIRVADAIDRMLAQPSGETAVHLIESGLAFDWRFSWHAGSLTLDSSWFEIPGGIEKVLTERSTVVLPVEEFIAEWKMPMRFVLDALDHAGIVVTVQTDMLDLVRQIEAAIPRFGWLYADQELADDGPDRTTS